MAAGQPVLRQELAGTRSSGPARHEASRVFFQPTTAQMTKATHTTSAAATIT
jgi:hypothetical protein